MLWLTSAPTVVRAEEKPKRHSFASGKRKRRLGEEALSLRGCVLVTPGELYRGPGTPWPRDCWVLHAEWQRPADAFTLMVQGSFCFEKPLLVENVLSPEGVISVGPWAQRAVFRPFIPEASWGRLRCKLANGQMLSFQEALASWGVSVQDLQECSGGTLAVRVPRQHREDIWTGDSPWLFILDYGLFPPSFPKFRIHHQIG